MSSPSSPPQPNERTVALTGHHIENAIALWRNGAALVGTEPQPRREEYERAVSRVLATLQGIPNVPLLLRAFFTITEERWRVLAEACAVESGWPPLRSVVEDCAFDRRFREIIASSHQAGPSPRG